MFFIQIWFTGNPTCFHEADSRFCSQPVGRRGRGAGAGGGEQGSDLSPSFLNAPTTGQMCRPRLAQGQVRGIRLLKSAHEHRCVFLFPADGCPLTSALFSAYLCSSDGQGSANVSIAHTHLLTCGGLFMSFKHRNRKTPLIGVEVCVSDTLPPLLSVFSCVSALNVLFCSSLPPLRRSCGKGPRQQSVGLTIASAPSPPNSISVGFSICIPNPDPGKLRWRGDTGQRKAADAAQLP